MVETLPSTRIFDLNIQTVTFEEARDHLLAVALERSYKAKIIVTPNVDHLVRLAKHSSFQQQYAKADYIFADGMPVVWASKMTSHPIPERITGADLFVALMKKSVESKFKIFIVGGIPGQEKVLTDTFYRVYPGCDVTIYCPSMSFTYDGEEGDEAVRQINNVKPDMVFVCLGMPKQENWAFKHQHELQTSLVFCVGAAMEFALGVKKRAPMWMQKNGLEWFWRFMTEPRRLWHRYFVQDRVFISLCWNEWKKQRINTGKSDL